MIDSLISVLFLEGRLLGPLMARNALKSNVTWSTYPFLPPTGASGCLAEVLGSERWYEGNSLGLDARRLQDTPGYEQVFALGAYPQQWRISRRHFRAHLGSIFNYEATIWSAGQNEGKKLAVVEELLAGSMVFVVGAADRSPLEHLHRAVQGRLIPVAKKGGLQFAFRARAEIIELTLSNSDGLTETLTAMPATEMGSLPRRWLTPGQSVIHYVPVRSRLRQGRMEWDVMTCVWEDGMRFRELVPIFAGRYGERNVGISQQLWDRLRKPWR